MRWFRRGEAAGADPASQTGPPGPQGAAGPHGPAAPAWNGTPVGADPADDPEYLRRKIVELGRFVNRAAGGLPVEALARARWVLDTLGEIVETSTVRPLEINAVLFVSGTTDDYLPTTLRSYLAVTPALRATTRPSGRTPTGSLIEQLDTLQRAASTVLEATRAQDADAVLTQGAFLRTRFTGSDLDL